MAVLVLLSLLAGLTMLSFDGVTRESRLRAGLTQVAACDELARTLVWSDGRPRRVVLATGADTCQVEEPIAPTGQWQWAVAQRFRLARGVAVDAVVGAPSDDEATESTRIRIRSDGTSVRYAIVLRTGDARGAVTLDGVTGAAEYVFDVPEPVTDLVEHAE